MPCEHALEQICTLGITQPYADRSSSREAGHGAD